MEKSSKPCGTEKFPKAKPIAKPTSPFVPSSHFGAVVTPSRWTGCLGHLALCVKNGSVTITIAQPLRKRLMRPHHFTLLQLHLLPMISTILLIVFMTLTPPITSVTAVVISGSVDSLQICIRTSHVMCLNARNGTYLMARDGLRTLAVSKLWSLPRSYLMPSSCIPQAFVMRPAVLPF